MRKNYARIICALVLTVILSLPESSFGSTASAAQSQQRRSVVGTITDDSGPVTGASIVIEGTSTGTISGPDGSFAIEASPSQTLVVSFIGYVTQRIVVGDRTTLSVDLEAEALAVDEVVVTALGITREKKALGYSLQEVSGEALVSAREVNVTNALSGKIAGLQIIRSSNGPAGSSKIVLRGNNSLTGDNQPLIVVDGVPMENRAGATNNDYWNPSPDMGNGLSDINPEDIESMTVLKGGSAAALYGSRAGNGVIMITTKSGGRTEGLGITISSSASFETIFMRPDMQSSYGQGGTDIFSETSSTSWGPRIEGQEVVKWNDQTVKLKAYDNVKNFFNTGTNLTENITFQQQHGKSSFYTSLSRTDDRSMVPGATYGRTNLTGRSVSVFGKDDRWTLDTKVQYIRSVAKNRPLSGNNVSNSFLAMYLLPRSLDIRDFDPPTDEFGEMTWFIPPTTTSYVNPYWAAKYNLNEDKRDRFLLSGALKYKFTDWLEGEIRGGSDMYTTTTESKVYAGSPIIKNGRYSFGHDTFYENNFSVLFTARKDNLIDKMGVAGSLGGNLMERESAKLVANSGEFEVPNLFMINNGINNPTVDDPAHPHKKINSIYGTAQVNWDGYLFLDATFRNDWSSALAGPLTPKSHMSFFYPSVSLAYVFTDMAQKINMDLPSWLSFAKLRGSFAAVGNDMDPYQLLNTYVIGKDPTGGTVAGLGGTRFDPLVKNELIKTWEAGAELRFLRNRLGIDFAWYKSNATNQLINIPMDAASGYSSMKINAGNIQNTGIELMVDARILDYSDGLTWDMGVNFSRNRNTIISLHEAVTQYELGGYDDLKVLAVAGGDYGEIYGSTFLRVTDKQSDHYGKLLLSAEGLPQINTASTKLGTQQATALLGITNTFAYKGFALSFLIDCRFGGKIFSATNAYMQAAGTAAVTAPGGKRDNVIVNGVIESGDTYAVNSTEITTQQYWTAVAAGRSGHNMGVSEFNTYDATNIRLRNLQLNYSFSKRSLARSPFQQVRIGVSCNNVWMIKSHLHGVDPESVFATGTNAVGFEGGASPTSRTFMFNVTLGF